MEYQDNHDSVREWLNTLDEGDRIHIEADSAQPQDPESSGSRKGIFERGDRILIDDNATVIEDREASPWGVLVELDEQWISMPDSDGWATNEFYLNGGEIVADWKDVRDEEEKEKLPDSELHKRPANYQVAILNHIELTE
jgi:hypothetical protein